MHSSSLSLCIQRETITKIENVGHYLREAFILFVKYTPKSSSIKKL